MRTKTLRGLAAGAGAAAVLVAGASTATAIPGQPTAAFWEGYFATQGVEDVTCHVSVVSGEPGILDVEIGEDWEKSLVEGNEWIGVVIKVANEYDVHEWAGYGAYHYGLDVPGQSPGNITHAIVCQAPVADEAEETEAPGDGDEQTEAPGDGDEQTEAPGETTEPAETDEPTGPPVETDGPADPAGMNLGMVGGAALVLAGAGAAGWAMRRRPGQH